MEREVATMSDLRHKNVVLYLGCSVDDWGPGQVQVSLAMEICHMDLAGLMNFRGRFSSQEAAVIVKQVLEGLQYLYPKNVVHR